VTLRRVRLRFVCDSAAGEQKIGFFTLPQGGSLRRNDEAGRARSLFVLQDGFPLPEEPFFAAWLRPFLPQEVSFCEPKPEPLVGGCVASAIVLSAPASHRSTAAVATLPLATTN
jgi:hypothetical protein